jgi:hypothetical protein
MKHVREMSPEEAAVALAELKRPKPEPITLIGRASNWRGYRA